MLFKEPGSFKLTKRLGGNVDESKIYRLKPLSTPAISRWTLPLTSSQYGVPLKFIKISAGILIFHCEFCEYSNGPLTSGFAVPLWSCYCRVTQYTFMVLIGLQSTFMVMMGYKVK